MVGDDRRLHPIFRAFDQRAYPLALRLCDKALRLDPSHAMIKALKAQALCYLERFDEAELTAMEVRLSHPVDIVVLNNLALTYRNLARPDQAVKVFEEAMDRIPKRLLEPVGTQWYLTCVRAGDAATQYKAAVTLNKQFKHKRFLMWTVMALLARVADPTTPAAQRTLFHSLMERMLCKAESNGDIDTPEALRTFLQVMEIQGKPLEAVKVLQKPQWQAHLAKDSDLQDQQMHLLLLCQRYQDALSLAQSRIEAHQDEWLNYQTYITALTELATTHGTEFLATIDTGVAFLRQLATKGRSPRTLLLAQLELLAQCRKRRWEFKAWSLPTIIHEFTSQMGHHPSAFEDIQPYLQCLVATETTELLDQIQMASQAHQAKLDVKTSLRSYLNLTKLRLALTTQTKSPVVVDSALIGSLIQCFARKFSLNYRDSTFDHADYDDALLLAAQLLSQQHFYDSTNKTALYTALHLLDAGLLSNKSNFRFKLLAIRLCYRLGVYLQSLQWYKSLDIKNVQLDTLSHWMVGQGRDLGFYQEDASLSSGALAIYQSNEIETPEMLVMALKNETYSHVANMLEFQRRLTCALQQSITVTSCTRSQMVLTESLDALFDMLEQTDLDNFKCDDDHMAALADNRDFTVMPCPTDTSESTFEQLTRPPTAGSADECLIASMTIHALHCIASHKLDQLDQWTKKLVQRLHTDAKAYQVGANTHQYAMGVTQVATAVHTVLTALQSKPPRSSEAQSAAEQLLLLAAGWTETVNQCHALTRLTSGLEVAATIQTLSVALELGNVFLVVRKALRLFTPSSLQTKLLLELVDKLGESVNALFQAIMTRSRQYTEQVTLPSFLSQLRSSLPLDPAYAKECDHISQHCSVDSYQFFIKSWEISFKTIGAEASRRLKSGSQGGWQ
ncbi:mitochondrial distribution and morphology [Dimargaris verticillata]|uniref:Mitochondrial distribution and morphology n=1 Tax=Dimargaris verticillata TaxID=2761393 RepID=A0A9W8B1T4_9FUNG|nr:mitochondrial distribution and morphology [Dimargaris verticillata]